MTVLHPHTIAAYLGLVLTSEYGTFDLYYGGNVNCANGTCGQYGQLLVTPIIDGSPAAELSCTPPTNVVQLQFCLITGSSGSGAQTVQTFSTVSYGLLNLTVASLPVP